MLGAQVLMRRGHVQMAAVVFIAINWIVLVVGAIRNGGLYSPSFLTQFVLVLAATLLLGRPAGLTLAALNSLVGLALVYTPLNGSIQLSLQPQAVIIIWLCQALLFFYVAVVTGLAKSSTDEALAQLRHELAERKRTEKALKEMEEQFYQAQKMESIGRLAGGIAHDLNNMLIPIIGYAELNLETAPPGSGLHADLSQIQQAGQRAANLIKQLLIFSRQQQNFSMQVIDLNEAIIEFKKMLQRLIGEDIELQTFLAPTLSQVKADKVQLDQVLMNLSINARDAMPDGGKLIIETANTFLDEAYVANHIDTRPGPHVMLAVSDTGCGMDLETQRRIFEPFFTTKEQGKGTGLGLATVFGIVKQHQGSIWLYSEPGKGTTFKIYLPQAETTPSTPQATLSAPVLAPGTETVLVVEDEESVRKLVCDTLAASGYQVIEAKDVNHGLQLAAERQNPIHLLLTDVIMPHMDGRTLYQQMMGLHPELKVLYMSGYTDNVVIQREGLQDGINFLQKPFTLSSLTQKVREALR
jgi:signal transduction histidine kinase